MKNTQELQLNLQKITYGNLREAEVTIHVAFPQRGCDYIPDILLALDGKTDFTYYLAFDATYGIPAPLGICSIGHQVPYDNKSVWIDAFGVTPDGASVGAAAAMLAELAAMARKMGAKYLRTIQFEALGAAREQFLLDRGFHKEPYAFHDDICLEDAVTNQPAIFTYVLEGRWGKAAQWGSRSVGLKDKLERMKTSDERRIKRQLSIVWDIDPVTKTCDEQVEVTENGVPKEKWTPSQAVTVARSLNYLAQQLLQGAMPKMLEMEGYKEPFNAPR